MKKKEHFILLLICLIIFVGQTAIAGADWKEQQTKMFAQISVKPGDVIDKTNWQKAKGLVPERFLKSIKDGDQILNIAALEYDNDWSEAYYKLSAKNEGKYKLGPKKEILDARTNEVPIYLEGMPFPNIDMKNDPDGPAKFMHNNNVNIYRQGQYAGLTYPKKGNLQWIGRSSGYERGVGFLAERVFWWNRPKGEIPNPRKFKLTTINLVTFPYDVYGTATLYVRHLDGRPDSVYAYVPAIRRVKRLSGANRSDPQMGSDMTQDDAKGFEGQIESMKWSFVDERIMLKPLWNGATKRSRKMEKTDHDSWSYKAVHSETALGYDTEGWTGVSWAYTGLVWVPRKVYRFKAEPLDPYYGYGTFDIYADALTTMICFSMKYTRAGELWKTILSVPGAYEIEGEKNFTMDGPMAAIDHKTDHASCLSLEGNLMDFGDPRVNPSMHTPVNLRTMSK